METPSEFDERPHQRGRREGASIVAGWVMLGMLPCGLIAPFVDDPSFAVWVTTVWAWMVAAIAGAYVSFSRPSK